MGAANLTNPIFSDEAKARAYFESVRWPGGVPVCPHCGVVGDAAPVARDEDRAAKRKKAGKSIERDGLYYCRSCEKKFTATMGTVYEDSHIPLSKWMLATYLMNSCKRGVSALELQRQLGLGSYRTAWFMAHRIREGMGVDKHGEPMGGAGKIVEADETYYGRSNAGGPKPTKRAPRRKHKDTRPKRAVVALVERGGKSRVFHVSSADKETVAKIILDNVDPNTRLHTDESRLYTGADSHTKTHETVKHSGGEYVRGDVHTNSVEGFFGQFKAGMLGVYGHCDEKYLGRYLKEFEFRHNHRVKLGFNDGERAALAVKGTVGKRLTLRQPKGYTAPT
jgi:transposase-like protein